MPKLLLGGTPAGFAVGVRNSVVAPIAYQILVLEAGHEWLSIDGRGHHQVRALAGVDAAVLMLLALTGDHPEHLVEERR